MPMGNSNYEDHILEFTIENNEWKPLERPSPKVSLAKEPERLRMP